MKRLVEQAISGILTGARADDIVRMAGRDPSIAQKIVEAAAMEDGGRTLRKTLADLTWERSPAIPETRTPPVAKGEALSGREWSARPESRIGQEVRSQMGAMPPELAARVEQGDTEALYEAYRMLVDRGDSAGKAPKRSPSRRRPATVEDSIREMARPTPSIADQFDATFRADVMPSRATAPGASTLSYGRSAAMNQPRSADPDLWGSANRYLAEEGDRLAAELRGIEGDLAGMRTPRPVATPDDLPEPPRQALADPPARSFDYRPAAALAAGAGAVGAGLSLMNQDTPSVDGTAGTADLAAESSPPPAVASAEDEFTDRFKRQFTDREQRRAEDGSLQARILIDRLNDMRRKAGGEVPQAPQMMAEINRLLAKGNEQVRQPDFRPGDKASRYRQQAQNLINRLNDMRREAGGEVPQAQQIMAEVRRLQGMADQLRNAG
jgi:hypothetical protein